VDLVFQQDVQGSARPIGQQGAVFPGSLCLPAQVCQFFPRYFDSVEEAHLLDDTMQSIGGPSAFGPSLFLFEASAEVFLTRNASQSSKTGGAHPIGLFVPVVANEALSLVQFDARLFLALLALAQGEPTQARTGQRHGQNQTGQGEGIRASLPPFPPTLGEAAFGDALQRLVGEVTAQVGGEFRCRGVAASGIGLEAAGNNPSQPRTDLRIAPQRSNRTAG
jgi:hypothetical protein